MGRFFAGRGDVAIKYALFNGSDGVSEYGIGAATFENGEWTFSTVPVITPGSSGAWDDSGAHAPWLLWDGGQYRCYYGGYDGTNFRIGLATAPANTGPWTKHASNPLIGLGSPGAFDDGILAFPTVLYEPSDTGKEWKMWYEGGPGVALGEGTVGYAHSSDGLSWTKVGQVIAKGTGGSWNDEGVFPGAIVKIAGTYYLFVAGRQGTTNPRWQGGFWSFTDPEGTYTPNVGNPVLLARFNDPNTSFTLTADLSASGTEVHISTTAGFNVGEPVVLVADNVETEVNAIASIDSGTQLMLETPTLSAFAMAHAGGIRSFHYNSVTPRTVRALATGGYEMFLAAFQPVEELTPAGSKIREGSMRATASALAGPWAYDYAAGLLFPINVPGTMFGPDAENPSVIVAP